MRLGLILAAAIVSTMTIFGANSAFANYDPVKALTLRCDGRYGNVIIPRSNTLITSVSDNGPSPTVSVNISEPQLTLPQIPFDLAAAGNFLGNKSGIILTAAESYFDLLKSAKVQILGYEEKPTSKTHVRLYILGKIYEFNKCETYSGYDIEE